MSYKGEIPVLQLPRLQKDTYRAQIERAYGGLPVCTSSGLTMNRNESNLKTALEYFLRKPTLYAIGLTHVDTVMQMYAFCQVASYRLQVGVFKEDVIEYTTKVLDWKTAETIAAIDMVFIMGKIRPNWVFRNESGYMKKYLNSIGFV